MNNQDLENTTSEEQQPISRISHIDNNDKEVTMADLTPGSTASPPLQQQQAVVAYLSIRKQPPTHVFYDELIEVEFSIEAVRGSSDSPPTNVSIQASLLEGEVVGMDEAAGLAAAGSTDHALESAGSGAGASLSPSSMMSITVLEEPRVSASRRTGKLKCRITCPKNSTSSTTDTTLSDPQQPRSCVIRLSTRENIVSEVSTREITIVNAKVKVMSADTWNPIWYKDEGGRDKCMEVHVAVYDSQDELVPEICGPLTLALCYDDKLNYTAVTNQDLLRPLGIQQTQQMEGGRARVRFRIEDVSKNHQGQDFCVKIATANPFVAPGWTPSVSVRSKRNKRQRTSLLSSSSGGGGSFHPDSSSASQHHGAGVLMPPSSSTSLISRSVAPTMQQQQKLTTAQHRSSSYGEHRIIHESSAGPGSGSGPSPPSASSDHAQQQQQQQDMPLRSAIHGVLQWSEEVVNGLYPLQWQILGYAQHVDGTPDYSRPYHSMPNPNAQIARILTQYSDQIRNQLRILEEAALMQRGTGVTGSVGGNGTPAGSSSSGNGNGAGVGGGGPQQQHPDSPFPSSAAASLPQDPYGMMMMHQQAGGPPPPSYNPHRSPPTMMAGMMMPPQQQQQQQPQSMRMAATTQPQQTVGSLRPPPLPPPPPPPQPPQQVLHSPSHIMEGTPTAYRDMYQPYPQPYPDYHFYGRPPPPPAYTGQYPPHASAYHQRYDESLSDPLPVRMGPSTAVASTAATAKGGGIGGSYHPRAAAALEGDEDDENEEEDFEEEEEEDYLESNVEYVLAKQYKSLRTGQLFGFPAFSAQKRFLGFYRESSSSSPSVRGGAGAAGAGAATFRTTTFVPLRRDAVDYDEIVEQASIALQKAMDTNSEALHSLKVWGSISSMVDHALVYDWRKGMSGGGSAR